MRQPFGATHTAPTSQADDQGNAVYRFTDFQLRVRAAEGGADRANGSWPLRRVECRRSHQRAVERLPAAVDTPIREQQFPARADSCRHQAPFAASSRPFGGRQHLHSAHTEGVDVAALLNDHFPKSTGDKAGFAAIARFVCDGSGRTDQQRGPSLSKPLRTIQIFPVSAVLALHSSSTDAGLQTAPWSGFPVRTRLRRRQIHCRFPARK